MSQVNEETGNHRPVILSLKCMEKELPIFAPPILQPGGGAGNGSGDGIRKITGTDLTTATVATVVPQPPKDETIMDTTTSTSTAPIAPTSEPPETSNKETIAPESKFPGVVLQGLEQFNTKVLVGACVRLMSHDFDKDTLHAIMRVCLRLTRSFENAEIFAREGGIKLLLQMKQTQGYTGFTTLATLLIRHVIEEPKTLTLAMENVVYSRTLPIFPPGCKELLYMTRQMSSAISRNPSKFKEVAQQILRIDVEILKRNQLNEDNRYLLKSLHPVGGRTFTMEDPVAVEAVKDLLHFLIQPDVPITSSTGAATSSTSKTSSKTYNVIESRAEQSNRSTDTRLDDRFQPFAATRTTSLAAANKATEIATQSKVSPNADKTLFSKTDILRILGDAVRSYQTVSLLITQHVYKAGSTPTIQEDTTALSYILDKLLYTSENGQDKECGTMAQFLISGLAATSDVVSVQYAVVTEVKSALLRAFMIPESMEKHLQIEMIAGLIPVMIDSYVSADNHLMSKSQQFQSARYNIFYIMLRKGLISDLAKAAQYLDLSGPHTVATINYILKPLELLLRMSNEPLATSMLNKKKSNTQAPVQGQPSTSSAGNTAITPSTSAPTTTTNGSTSGGAVRRPSRPGTSTGRQVPAAVQEEQQSQSGGNPFSESTVAQDETMTDDSENTDYDISTVPESGIETTSEAQIQVDLSEILNSFLREDMNNENEQRTRDIIVAEESLANAEGDHEQDVDGDGEFSNMRGETGDTSSESGDDSVSNASDQEGPELEEEEEASENDEEADEHSELDVDEETRQFIEMYDQNLYSVRSPNIPELERDNEDILMIQYQGNNAQENETENNAGGAGNAASTNPPNNDIAEIRLNDPPYLPAFTEQSRRRLLNSRADTGPSTSNTGPGNDENSAAPASHPLLVRRHSTSQSQEGTNRLDARLDAGTFTRGSRAGRQRRFNYFSMNGRGTNPPIILQRLLGPSNTGKKFQKHKIN